MVPSSRRGNTSSETQRRENRAAREGKWPLRGMGTTVLTYPGSAPRKQARLVKTVTIQVKWAAVLTLDKTVGSRVWRHTQLFGGRPTSDLGWGSSSKRRRLRGRYRLVHRMVVVLRTETAHSTVRPTQGQESVLRPPFRALPSVIVDTEKVLREADGSVELVVVRPHADGKLFAPWVLLESRSGEPVRSPKNTSAMSGNFIESFPIPVEGLYPTPHIHEQMTAYIMATSTATLSTTR